MINHSIIQKSQLEGANRIDAEFFHPEKLKAVTVLEEQAGKKISEYFLSSKKIFNPISQKLENGAVVYDLTDALGLFLDDGEKVESAMDIGSAKRILEKNDVIISRLRAYLKEIAFVRDDKNLKLASTEFFSFRKKKGGDVFPEILFSFLQTDIVQKILEWSQEGVNHPRFSDDVILNLKFPNILIKHQDNIKSLIGGGSNLYLESKKYYQQAEALLLGELGLDNFSIDGSLFSVVNLSDIQAAGRMDADFFQIKYKKLLEALNKFDIKKIIEIAKRKKSILKVENKNEYKYIEIGDISVGSGEINHNFIFGDELPANAKLKINGGELIISKVRPTRGAIAIIPNSWSKNFIGSGAFSIFEVESPTREYLQVVLRSIIGKLQLEKPTTGTSYPTVTDEDIENIIIPILPKEARQKISDLVRQSHEARKKSKELLEEAKRKVEELIEKAVKQQ